MLIHLNNYFEKIKALRINQDMTQKDIADFLQMTVNAYQKYEYGKREPNMETFIALADFFNVSLDYLVGRKFPKEEDNPEVNK